MSSTKTNRKSVKDRIMETASNLFYTQGYRATGINQIIRESGVAKASFYDHFASKEDLLYAYAVETSDYEMDDIRSDIKALRTPRERFFGPMKILAPWCESTDYRGCPFQNLIAEAPPDAERAREVSRRHRERVRELFRELARELAQSDPALANLDTDAVADMYVVIFEGTIASAVAFRELWPIHRGVEALQKLVDQYRE